MEGMVGVRRLAAGDDQRDSEIPRRLMRIGSGSCGMRFGIFVSRAQGRSSQ